MQRAPIRGNDLGPVWAALGGRDLARGHPGTGIPDTDVKFTLGEPVPCLLDVSRSMIFDAERLEACVDLVVSLLARGPIYLFGGGGRRVRALVATGVPCSCPGVLPRDRFEFDPRDRAKLLADLAHIVEDLSWGTLPDHIIAVLEATRNATSVVIVTDGALTVSYNQGVRNDPYAILTKALVAAGVSCVTVQTVGSDHRSVQATWTRNILTCGGNAPPGSVGAPVG